MGIWVWGVDQAGPLQSMPYPGSRWEPHTGQTGMPASPALEEWQSQADMSLLHPSTGEVRVKGVHNSCTNAVLHPWLKEHLRDILKTLPPPQPLSPREIERYGEAGKRGLG
jgi:hypothetical protein